MTTTQLTALEADIAYLTDLITEDELTQAETILISNPNQSGIDKPVSDRVQLRHTTNEDTTMNINNATDEQLAELEKTMAYLDVLIWTDEQPLRVLKASVQSWLTLWAIGTQHTEKEMKLFIKQQYEVGDLRKRDTWSGLYQRMMRFSFLNIGHYRTL